MKSLIPATAVLLMLQGIADLIGAVMVLTGAVKPEAESGGPPSEAI